MQERLRVVRHGENNDRRSDDASMVQVEMTAINVVM